MAGEDVPEIGDKASWNWNGATPGGEVVEKKTEGEVAIESKRGNTIKKAAKPDDPAIHLARSGNDVVKNQSELQVDEKNAGGDKSEDKEEESKESKGTKRKADDEPEAEGEGKAAPPSAKKAKAGRPKGAAKKAANGDKKTPGRPKGQRAAGGAKKEKKEKKPPAPPTGVGKRTRSQK